MTFGHFDDAAREYVITTPETPYPWINYLGNDKFFGLISNTSGGYCFYRDARLRRITRYRYNNIPVDDGGRYFYLKDGDDVWSPGWKPVKKELESYECRHGLGYTRITGSRGGVSASQLAFVPLGYNGEVHQLTIKNNNTTTKNLKLFSLVEFNLWNAFDDMTNFQRNFSTGEVEIEGSTIYHKTEYRERRDHFAFFSANVPMDGYDTDREAFIGIYNGFDSPKAVMAGAPTNSKAAGWQPIGSHFFNLTLAPNEEKTIVFILGYVENPADDKWEKFGVINKKNALAMQAQYDSAEKVAAALQELSDYWTVLLSKYQAKTGDARIDRMVNIWNPYQCMVTFNMSRSASYFESGIGRGMGFRDSNQDLLGFVHQIPERARERILDIAATQFEDGGCYHQYQPLTKKGNHDIGGGFNDDPMWLVLAVAAYIKETGDWSILDEQTPFDCNPDNTASLLEHLKRSFYHVVENVGPHGLPLIGRADWNDCLNLNCNSITPDESYQTFGDPDGRVAESVFIAGMFTFIGPEYAYMLRKKGRMSEADEADLLIEKMKETVIKHGYDEEWFLRAYDAKSQVIGSKTCNEGQIFIEPQGMCIMGNIGLEDGRAEKALNAVKERLDTPYGIVLQNPAYQSYHPNLGEISSYPPGYKENAGIFCHNNPWIVIAETKIGRGGEAFEYYKKTAPAFVEEISEIHKTEPYVYSQMIAGKDAVKPGEAKNSWLTGCAAWTFVAISQAILGVQPDYEGLKVDPCIPSDWKQLQLVRKFRGATYDITVKNPNGIEKGIVKTVVDGQEIAGNILPIFEDGKTHIVEMIMG